MLSPEAMLTEYRRLHECGLYSGVTLRVYKDKIALLCESLGVRSLLDYGCGKAMCWSDGRLQARMRLKELALYDPGVPEFSQKPEGRFDAVIAIDVLEHVHPDEVPSVVSELCSRARKLVYASICCRPSKGSFADGTNLHCTVRPMSWWRERFADRFTKDGLTVVLVETL